MSYSVLWVGDAKHNPVFWEMSVGMNYNFLFYYCTFLASWDRVIHVFVCVFIAIACNEMMKCFCNGRDNCKQLYICFLDSHAQNHILTRM